MKKLIQSRFLLFTLFFFAQALFADVGPIIPGQSLWCIDKRIASTADIIESKLCEIDVSALDVNTSIFEAIICSKLEIITLNSLESLSKLDITSSLVDFFTACMPMEVTGSTVIDAPGIYCVTQNFSGTITIDASDVQLNVNNHVVIGGVEVTAGKSNIKIYDGTIEGIGSADAILVNAGSSDIQISNVAAKSADNGICFEGVTGGLIENCSMTSNGTGLALNYSHKIMVDNCIADCNEFEGFSLAFSTTCCVLNSKALSTGQDNTNTSDQTIIGFVASGGYGNVFENCISNGTQGLLVTDFDSVIAGFALRNEEECSKIISCEASNTQTDDAGFARPIGIWVEQVVQTSLPAASFVPTGGGGIVTDVAWEPLGQFFVLSVADEIRLFEFDRNTLEGILQDTITTPGGEQVVPLAWSPCGSYMAAGYANSGAALIIYEFDRSHKRLVEIVSIDTTTSLGGIAWHPSGKYIVALEADGTVSGDLILYEFDRIAQTVTFLDSTIMGTSNFNIAWVDWNPNGKFIAVCVGGYGGSLAGTYLIEFDLVNKTLNNLFTVPGGTGTTEVIWSPDGLYVALLQNGPTIYTLDRTNKQLINPTVAILPGTRFGGLQWSNDSEYVCSTASGGGGPNNIYVQKFNRDTNTVTIEAISQDFSGETNGSRCGDWSRDGSFIISVGGYNVDFINIVEPFRSSKNVIKDNVVYCNSGGSDPLGIGISANSVANLVVGNTSYSNPLFQKNNESSGPILGTNYAFVTNVFNPLFQLEPTALQNISIGGCEQICMPPDLALLASQQLGSLLNFISKTDILESKIDNFAMASMPPCAATPIVQADMPTMLTAAGIYCVAEPLTGDITISGVDIGLDLNSYRVIGSVIVNGANAKIYDGTVDGDGANAIQVNSGANNISLNNVTAKNGLVGLSIESVSGGVISNCEFVSNTTGVQMDSAFKLAFQACTASCNKNAGFDLAATNSFNSFIACKALSTGEGNTELTNQTIVGFVSADGYGNVFERCIANATQALSTTDSNSLVAGFALRGTEACTKIIDCESANTQTDDAGLTVPHGIMFDYTIDSELALIASACPSGGDVEVLGVDWSNDAKYIAVSHWFGNEDTSLSIYQFNSSNNSLVLLDAVLPGDSNNDFMSSVKWSPTGEYVVVGGNPDSASNLTPAYLYRFNKETGKLFFLQALSVGGSANDIVNGIAWTSDEQYLALGGSFSSSLGDVLIYSFDRIAQKLTLLNGVSPSGSNNDIVQEIDWSPDGKYIVIGGMLSAPLGDIYVYEYDRINNQFIFVAAVSPNSGNSDDVSAVKWSDDGKYLGVVLKFSGTVSVFVYEFDYANISFIASIDIGDGAFFQLSWAPDGQHLAVSGVGYTGSDLLVYGFDKATRLLRLVSTTTPTSLQGGQVSWSPGGDYIAVGQDNLSPNELGVYQAYQFPSKNVIKDNVVYCNLGGIDSQSGVGISGSSIKNMIVGNTSYNNPQDPFMISQNYTFVTNVFNSLFGNEPTALQNISIGGCEQICQPQDLVLLAKQLKLQIINEETFVDTIIQKACAIESLIDVGQGACASTTITQADMPTNLSMAGIYCVDENLIGNITISSSEIVLDLNNYKVTGEISGNNVSNVLIKNGVVENLGMVNCILFDSGSSDITIQNVTAKLATNGINFNGVTGGLVEHCSMTQNSTGLLACNSHKIVVNNCIADCNLAEGFCLVASTTCCLTDCKAISTGQGNTDTGAVDIFGFVSAGGYGNIFERCIANGTQSLFSTNFDSNVAGFALRAATIDSQEVFEQCTKIINCEASNTQTTPDGQARPIGIWLEEKFVDMELTITAVPDIKPSGTVNSVHWSPDAQLLAVGADDDTIRIYQMDHENFILMQIESLNPGFADVLAVRWSPDGTLLAVGFESGTPANRLRVYEFDRTTNTLIERAAPPTTINAIGSIDWHPAGTYLAALEFGSGANLLHIFSYDRIDNTMAFVDSLDDLGGLANGGKPQVRWNPDGTHLATTRGQFIATNTIALLTLVNNTLALVFSIDSLSSSGLAWSFDGNFLVISRDTGTPSVRVYTLDRENNQLINPSGDGPDPQNSFDAIFSPNGSYVSGTGFNSKEVFAALYDRTSNDIGNSLAQSPPLVAGQFRPVDFDWSPEGQFLALGTISDLGNQLTILQALHSPSKNIIKDNVVYCNSGGSIPHGIGISANSVCNLVVGNIAYANPINPPGGVETNYAFVTNVYNSLFAPEPTALQNLSIGGCEPICQPVDIPLLVKQLKAKLCQVQATGQIVLDKACSILDRTAGVSACTEPLPIAQADMDVVIASGNYCLSENVSGTITINGVDIDLDLNNYKVTGDVLISSGSSNISIFNGVIDNASAMGNAISATNASNVNLSYVKVINAQVGINFEGVSGGSITHCEMTSNTTGLELDSTHKIVVNNCIASCNTNAGFCLLSSTTNCFTDCKALSTGEGNNEFTDQTIFGFVSTNGNGNIFERCIANATQALSTIDVNSIVAGIALRGNEQCTKIIECESGNTASSLVGDTTAYGIYVDSNESVKKNLIIKNVVYCTSGAHAVGILGSDLRNLIVQNTVYNSGANLQIGSQADEIISSIDNPTTLQNIAVPGCGQICQPADLALLTAQIITKIDQPLSTLAEISNKISAVTFIDTPCAPVAITAGTVITASNIYCVQNPISGSITVSATASDAEINLNNYTLTGQIIINATNVTIRNGTVDPDNASLDAIIVNADDVTIKNVTVKNALRGIDIESVTGGLIANCTLTQNVTGIEIDSSHKLVVDGCIADCNTNAGFCFIQSTTCFVNKCKALSTGQGNEETVSQTIVGFISAGGYGNIFEQCISNGTQGLQVMDSNSIVAGFALRNSEQCTKIIDSESGNTVSSLAGNATAYGIYIDPNEQVKKNLIMRNVVYCTSGSNSVGILGSDLRNLIIQNTVYNSGNNLQIGSQADEIVSCIDNPTALQNSAIPGCEQIGQPADLALLINQVKTQVCLAESFDDLINSKLDLFNSAIDAFDPCGANEIKTPTTITAPGIYCLSQNVAGSILINMNDVQIDLNNRIVTGDISIGSGISNIKIYDGVVDNNNLNGSAISAAAGASSITIKNVTTKNAQVGINFDGVSGGFITNCSMTFNSTGVELNASHKIVIDNCTASCNVNAGFDLINSTTNCLRDCKALSTGEENFNTIEQTIVGFLSTDGYANIFERCIANATQALSTTDSNSLVAGFALRGTEGCTKIIDCEAANSTTSPEGVTIPYGICIQESALDDVVRVATATVAQKTVSASWSQCGKYFAVGEFNDSHVYVYEFDRINSVLIRLAVAQTPSPGGVESIKSVDWHPGRNFIAVADVISSDVFIYEYETVNNTLTEVATANIKPSSPVHLEWSPDGKFLAVVDDGTNELIIYVYDPIISTLTQLVTNGSLTAPVMVTWSPDGKFLGVADTTTTAIFGFDATSPSLVKLITDSSSSNVVAIDWSPDGKFITIGNNTDHTIKIYSYDRQATSLAFIAASGATTVDIQSVAWSPDSTFIAVPDNPNGSPPLGSNILIYKFDRGNSIVKITFFILTNRPDGPKEADWSPDGKFILLADNQGNNAQIAMYQAFSMPNKNIIKDNVVYCNSGGSCPSGVGISGSSIQNLIVGNTAYSNPIPQEINNPIVSSNYIFVTNVFNQQFGIEPTALQNISLDGCEPICMPTDLGLVMKQSLTKLCHLVEGNLNELTTAVENIAIQIQYPCAATAITSNTVITASGSYCLGSNTISSIVIDADEVLLDLNNRTVTGLIFATGHNQLTIKNGVVDATSDDGIAMSNGQDIMLQDVQIKNAQVGLNLNAITGGLIERCTFTQNATGLELTNSAKIIVDNCTASCNTNAGFCLISSMTNCLIDCKALSTGEGNNQISDQTIFGFVSTNGNANVFERCIANSTQGLQVTDSDSLIAGFALRGSEQCSKIIDSEAANTQTDDAGETIPYGILLEATLDGFTTVTSALGTTGDSARYVEWSPDGKYLAVPLNRTVSNELILFRFDRNAQDLILVDSINPDGGVPGGDNLLHVSWHPSGNFLAVGATVLDPGPEQAVLIYEFDRINESLTEVTRAEQAGQPDSNSWSPDGTYLAVGNDSTGVMTVYSFNAITKTLTFIDSETFGVDTRAVEWSPDGKFILAMEGSRVGLYRFENNLLTLIHTISTGTTVVDGAWSRDGRYVAVVGSFTGDDLRVYRFDHTNASSELTEVDSSPVGSSRGVDWTPDGLHLAVASDVGGGTIRVFPFDRVTGQLGIQISLDVVTVTHFDEVTWSPDGIYLAAGGANTGAGNDALYVYQLFSMPTKNVIKNNMVYCNSGGSIPSGIGISGSSIANMIIGNTSYNNPEDPFMVSQNYAFVTNIFNSLFQQSPSLLQNISIGGCEPICMPEDLGLLIQQINYKIDAFDCAKIALTQADISSGTISITTSGSYCVATDLAANIVIDADCVSVDLNNRIVTGLLSVATGSDNATIQNGTVSAPAPTSVPVAAITIETGTKNAQVQRVKVRCANTTMVDIAGRAGIEIQGSSDTQIVECTIFSGDAGDSVSTDAPNGGDAIQITSSAARALIKGCILKTGAGGDSTSGAGGDGGHGINVGAASETKIISNTIFATGVGGAGSTVGGIGGHGVNISTGATKTMVTKLIIRDTGSSGLPESSIDVPITEGGSVTIPLRSRAINDEISTVIDGVSSIFANSAYKIYDSARPFIFQNEVGTLGQGNPSELPPLANEKSGAVVTGWSPISNVVFQSAIEVISS